MSTVTDIHKALLAGKKLTVKCESWNDFVTLRTQLYQLHQIPKLLLELTDDSIVAVYDHLNDRAIFYLGLAVDAPAINFSIEVIPDDA